MKKVFSKIQLFSERRVLLCLGAIGTALFLAVFFLMPPTEVTVWKEVRVETGIVKSLRTSFSQYSATKIYVVVETTDGKSASIPISMTDDIRAGDSISYSIEVSQQKKPKIRYTMINYQQNRGPKFK